MARRTAQPDAQDRALFRAAIGTVRELAPREDPLRAPAPPPEPRQAELDEHEALAQSREAPFDAAGPGDAARYRRPEIGERVWRRLRRGHYAVEDEIDLHRMEAAQAEAALRGFLNDSLRAQHHCLRIVHGKGLHSKEGAPVLRGLVEALLRRRADVLAYVSAPPAQGGTGALLVLLGRGRAG